MVTDLDAPLVKFSADPRDWWTLRDAVRGVQIFGGIGSGKSSGSGRTLALSFLKAGFGGLVLTGTSRRTPRRRSCRRRPSTGRSLFWISP